MATSSSTSSIVQLPEHFHDQLSRFESLGDNCEFGFVLRSLGLDDGSLFKWARLEISNLHHVLSKDFVNIFEYENLSPLRLAMVQESIYGIGWHSSLLCHIVNGKLEFIDDDSTRRIKHQFELRKFNYLEAKFMAKLKAGGAIFVFKSNIGIELTAAIALNKELRRLSEGAPYTLLVVTATEDARLWGTTSVTDDGIVQGFVDRFADYNTADDFSKEIWYTLISSALKLLPYTDWPAAKARAASEMRKKFRRLDFPQGGTQIGKIESDGIVQYKVESTNTWSRKIDEGFRLHSEQSITKPAHLEWVGVPLNHLETHFLVSFKLSVQKCKPVDLEIQVMDGDALVAHSFAHVSHEESAVELTVPAGYKSVAVKVIARRTYSLRDDDVAAIDIAPIELRSSTSTVSSIKEEESIA